MMPNFFLCSLLLVSTSCNRECIHYGNLSKQEIFYHCNGGYIVDNYETYEYYLVLTNYRNNTMRWSDFADIAKNYIDTVKTDKPIGDIIFLGQEPGGCIPSCNNDLKSFETYAIITIGFNGDNKNFKGNAKDISYVTFWKQGKSQKVLYLDDKKVRDSLLSSKTPLDNEK